MIRKMKRSIFFVLLLAAAASCKKSGGGEEPNPITPEAKAVDHGTPQGTPVTKSIGAAGGSIQSADGNIVLEIPAGAVSTAINFSIQTVTNTLSAGTGPSYRLLPENVQFQKDVKITLHYSDEDLDGTNEDDLYMAYQDKEGFWYRHIMTGIDKAKKTVYAQTRHFSDWTLERVFRITGDKERRYLEANQETPMTVYYQDVIVETGRLAESTMVLEKNVDTWFTTGPGTFDNMKKSKVKFKAPANIPEVKEIAVGVRIKNMVNRRNPDRPGNTGLAIVQVPVTLLSAEHFVWEVDGTVYTGHSTDGTKVGTQISLIGTGLLGQISVSANGEKGIGEYEPGNLQVEKKFHVQLSLPQANPPIYLTAYFPCRGSGVLYGSGTMKIEKFGDIGQQIVGTLTATTYAVGSGCDPKTKKVTGLFKIIRKL